jgi:Na+/proline symporter
MAENINLDRIRGNALNRIEKSERQIKWILFGAFVFEGLFFLVFLLAMERGNRTHWLLLISTVGGYTIIVFGLVILGLFSNRNTARILKAIELIEGQK